MEGETLRKMDVPSFDAVYERLYCLSNKYETSFGSPPARSVFRDVEILKAFLMDPPPLKLKDGSLEEIESLVRKVNSQLLSSDIQNMCISERIDWLNKLTKILEPIRDGTFIDEWVNEKELIRPSRMDYPTTDQLGFMEHLVENYLEELLKTKAADSLGYLKISIEELQNKLRLVTSRLMEMLKTHKEDAYLKDLIQSIAGVEGITVGAAEET